MYLHWQRIYLLIYYNLQYQMQDTCLLASYQDYILLLSQYHTTRP